MKNYYELFDNLDIITIIITILIIVLNLNKNVFKVTRSSVTEIICFNSISIICIE